MVPKTPVQSSIKRDKDTASKSRGTGVAETSNADEITELISRFEQMGGIWNQEKLKIFNQDSAKFFSHLTECLDDDDQGVFEEFDNAKEIWEHLKTKYSRTSESTVSTYISKIQKFPDDFDVDRNAKYSSIIDSFRIYPHTTTEEKMHILLEKEDSLKLLEHAHPAFGKRSRQYRRGSDVSMKDAPEKMLCYKCDGADHVSKSYPYAEEIKAFDVSLRKKNERRKIRLSNSNKYSRRTRAKSIPNKEHLEHRKAKDSQIVKSSRRTRGYTACEYDPDLSSDGMIKRLPAVPIIAPTPIQTQVPTLKPTEKSTQKSPEKISQKSPKNLIQEPTKKPSQNLNQNSPEKKSQKLTQKLIQKPAKCPTQKLTQGTTPITILEPNPIPAPALTPKTLNENEPTIELEPKAFIPSNVKDQAIIPSKESTEPANEKTVNKPLSKRINCFPNENISQSLELDKLNTKENIFQDLENGNYNADEVNDALQNGNQCVTKSLDLNLISAPVPRYYFRQRKRKLAVNDPAEEQHMKRIRLALLAQIHKGLIDDIDSIEYNTEHAFVAKHSFSKSTIDRSLRDKIIHAFFTL
ncbi:hypothetical protein EPUL_004667, partial [Erysiphe pulchra]